MIALSTSFLCRFKEKLRLQLFRVTLSPQWMHSYKTAPGFLKCVYGIESRMSTLHLEVLGVSKHQHSRGWYFMLLRIFNSRPLTHLHILKTCIDAAWVQHCGQRLQTEVYLLNFKFIADRCLFVQSQVTWKKSRGPSLSPLFLLVREWHKLYDTENSNNLISIISIFRLYLWPLCS